MRPKSQSRGRRFWLWVRPIIPVTIVMTAFRSSVADWNDVPTGSMKPAIVEGDRILVNKLAYDLKVPYTTWSIAEWSQPSRGEVVVFFCPSGGKRMVKRVIGCPGDVIAMRNNRLVINGEPIRYHPPDEELTEKLGPVPPGRTLAIETLGDRSHPVLFRPDRRGPIRSFGPITVAEGHYFLMGDNRDESMDSRYFGTVERGLIVGRSSTVVFSLDPNDFYLPRGDRFFRPLP